MNAPGELPPPDDRLDEDVARLRPPPQSREAEQSLLGALLYDPSSLAKVSDLVATTDFFPRSHRLIFDVISTLAGELVPIDVISVFERLQRDGNVEDAGGIVYLNQLAQSVPSASNARRYAEIIVERSTLRKQIALYDEATARAFRNEPAGDILNDVKLRTSKLLEERKLGRAGIPLLTLAELREESHNQSWLVKHVLPADSIGMLFGGSGTFKSFVGVDLAGHVAHGLPWLGKKTATGHVVYLAAEGGAGMWRRFCAWHKARRIPYDKAPISVIPIALDLAQDAWKVAEAAQAKAITPTLVVIDTLSQTFAGEENSAQDVSAYFREIGTRIRALWKCTVLIVHHTGHAETERPRGSSAMRANLDFMLGVHRDEKEMLATLSCLKQKEGDNFADTSFSLTPQRLGTDADGDEVKSLVARHISNADDLRQAMESEAKAGRGGNKHLLLGLLDNGVLESDVRTEFMKQCKGDNPETRKRYYNRAKAELMQQGVFDVAQGYIVTLFKASD